MRKFLVALLLVSSNLAFAATSTPSVNQYNGAFLSYFSTKDMSNLIQLIKDNKLAGAGTSIHTDKNFDTPTSLLATAKKKFAALKIQKPAFYASYDALHAFYAKYPIDNSYDDQGKVVHNPELVKSLAGVNLLSYFDLLPLLSSDNPSKIGTLYFDDPEFDLSPVGTNAQQDKLCNANPTICWHNTNNKPAGKNGNFNAFANLNRADDPYYRHMYKIVAVSPAKIDTQNNLDNFMNSALAVVNAYNFDGIDINLGVGGGNEFSEKLANVVATLRQKMPAKIIITTIDSDAVFMHDDYRGLSPHALNVIAINSTLVNFNYLDSKNYDIDGDKTAFAQNIEATPGNPHSVHELINTLKETLIDLSKVVLSVNGSSYAVGGIDAGPNKDGLFQSTAGKYAIPGAFDDANCGQTDSCSGDFPYNYIIDVALAKGQFVSHHYNQYGATSAYAPTWTPPQQLQHNDVDPQRLLQHRR
jgi:hypothetical protein